MKTLDSPHLFDFLHKVWESSILLACQEFELKWIQVSKTELDAKSKQESKKSYSSMYYSERVEPQFKTLATFRSKEAQGNDLLHIVHTKQESGRS